MFCPLKKCLKIDQHTALGFLWILIIFAFGMLDNIYPIHLKFNSDLSVTNVFFKLKLDNSVSKLNLKLFKFSWDNVCLSKLFNFLTHL